MAAPVHAFFHYPEDIKHTFACFNLAAPGQLIFHHHFRYLEPGFNAPMQQVARCFDGEGQVEYLMMYRSDGAATFIGLERITARIGDKAGTFVLQRSGVFEDGQAKESYSVVPGSATGELHGLRGEGTSSVGHGMEHPFTLDYELA